MSVWEKTSVVAFVSLSYFRGTRLPLRDVRCASSVFLARGSIWSLRHHTGPLCPGWVQCPPHLPHWLWPQRHHAEKQGITQCLNPNTTVVSEGKKIYKLYKVTKRHTKRKWNCPSNLICIPNLKMVLKSHCMMFIHYFGTETTVCMERFSLFKRKAADLHSHYGPV